MSSALTQAAERGGALLKKADVIIKRSITENRELTLAESEELGGLKAEIFRANKEEAEERHRIGMMSGRPAGSHGGYDSNESQIDLRGYSIARAIGQAATGNLQGLEAEVSQEIAHRSGKSPSGFYVPNSALVERRAGMSVTNDAGAYGGNAVQTDVLQFLEALRPLSKVIAAGATLFSGLTNNIAIPKQSAASTASWKSETAALDEVTPEIDQITLSPKRVGAFVELSNQLLIQSAPSIDQFIRRDLLGAIATAIDAAAINGPGGTAPTGILGTAGIGNVAGGTNGLAPTWAHICALVGAVANANADFGKLAFLTNSKVMAKLRSTAKVSSTDSMMILEGDSLLNYLVHGSNNVPSNLTKGTATGVCSAILFGNFEDVLIGSFGQATDLIVDRFSKATTGITRVIATSYVDIQVRRPESFAAMKDVLTA
jgi:HK97 family phage major capsid protein